MKNFFLLLTLLVVTLVSAQIEEEVKVKYAVETFFYAFHDKNELAMKRVVNSDILMQTVGLNMLGKMTVRNNNLINFMITTPDSISFQEKI